MALSVGDLVGYVDLDDSGFGSGLAGMLDRFKDAGGKMTKVAVGLGTGAATALGAGLLGAMNVDAANDKLAAQLGASGADAERLGKVAGDLYAQNYGDSIEQVDEALGAVASTLADTTHASQEQLRGLTGDALNLAKAFDLDVNDAVASAGILVKTKLAKDARQGFDLIATGLQHVPAAVRQDLLDASDEYSVFFQSLGFSGQEAFGVLAAASKGGAIQLDKAGDALKEFRIRSVDMSASSVAAYKALGLNADTMAKKILAGGPSAKTAFQQILDGVLSMKNPVAQSQTAVALFGTQFEDLGNLDALAALRPMTNALGKVDGAATQLGKTMNDNASSSLAAFGREVKTTLVNWVGGKALPTVQHIAASLRDGFGPALAMAADILKGQVLPAVKAVFGFLADHQTTVEVLAAIIVGVLIPLIIAWGVQSTIAGIKSVAAWVTTQAAAVKSVVVQSAQLVAMVAKWVAAGVAATINAAKVVAGWVISAAAATAAAVVMAAKFALMVAGWVLMGAQSLLAAAKVAAAWLIAMGPIGLVVAAVVGLVALIVANWDKVWGATKRIWSAVSGAISGAWNSIVGFVSSGVSKVVGFITGLPGRILGLGGQMLNAGKSLMQKLFDGLVALAKGAGSFAKDIGIAIINKVIDGLNKILPHRLHVPIPGPVPDIDVPLFPTIGHLEKGGPFDPGTFLVGEKGPELVQFGRSGRVTPAGPTRRILDGAAEQRAGQGTTQHITVNATTNADPWDIAREIAWQSKTAGV